MGVYIKGMEMPKRCGECPLSLYPHSPCWKNGGALDWENRPNWCPLIELPPHGRLIDADALVEIEFHGMQADKKISYQMGWNDAVATIAENAPTILEAEGETE